VTRGPQRRVVVTRTKRTARRPGAGGRHDLDEQTRLGEILIRSLIRAQLQLALRLSAVVTALLGSMPLLFAFVPAARTVHVVGLPLPWLLLGVLVYPGLVAGAVLYVRQAERNERDFEDLVDRS
jgi:hypothetical protein